MRCADRVDMGVQVSALGFSLGHARYFHGIVRARGTVLAARQVCPAHQVLSSACKVRLQWLIVVPLCYINARPTCCDHAICMCNALHGKLLVLFLERQRSFILGFESSCCQFTVLQAFLPRP